MPDRVDTGIVTQLVPWELWKGIAYGSFKEYYDGVNDIYDLIAGDDNEDVFIYEKPIIKNLYNMYQHR